MSMWNDPITYGSSAHGLTAPHPAHDIAGVAPSALFLESGGGTWSDRLVATLDGIRANRRSMMHRPGGLVVAPDNAPLTATFRMRLRGRLVVPRALAARTSAVPIVFIVMGNHRAFDLGNPAFPEIPNHTGYDYLQQSLADLGIASCSVDTNFANALNLGIRARAEILLATMAATQSSAPASIRGKLDFSKVGLVGHSRGGDAVVMGALLSSARSLAFGIKCVTSIAPTDFTIGFTGGRVDGRVPVPTSLGGNLRYLVLLGSHDGDVADVEANGFSLYDRATCDKTLIFARGLTHNRFNTVWNECADYADGRLPFVDDDDCRIRAPGTTFDNRIFAAAVHREYAKFFVGALARRTLLGDTSAEDVLRGLVAPSRTLLQQSPGLAGPAASVQWSLASRTAVDEFDTAGIGRRSFPSGPGRMEIASNGRPSVPHVTQSFVANRGDRVRIEVPAARKNMSTHRELTFRLTSMMPVTSESAIEAAHAPDWEVRIETAHGTAVCRPADLDRRGLREPNRPFFHEVYFEGDGDPRTRPAPINVTKNAYDTLVLPLSAFSSADLSDVRAIEFEAKGGELPLLVDSFAFV